MFAKSYFPQTYFAGTYFPPISGGIIIGETVIHFVGFIGCNVGAMMGRR